MKILQKILLLVNLCIFTGCLYLGFIILPSNDQQVNIGLAILAILGSLCAITSSYRILTKEERGEE